MGMLSRRKGARVERELVQKLKTSGYEAQRVPLSGATEYAKGDVEVKFNNEVLTIEVKARKDGFKKLYAMWERIEDRDGVFFHCGPGGFGLTENLNYVRTRDWGFGYGITPSKYYLTMKKLIGSSDILALKANNKPFLFMIPGPVFDRMRGD